ncbi:MarR family winged helix-turn-helix transcriptional regulator [Nocardia spumae]|uniref:MarR family winged helix-turn-helix transcriptional regulator n=1 Tax=Nocardia spumae TaxID=2887190 RepID=UPI001D14596A|nr:MarR family transcriptional regulator [Nocardia spumae]
MATGEYELTTAFGGLYRRLGAVYWQVARRFGLTSQQVELLCQLHDQRPSFGELATMLGCDKTNVTGMVDRLERRGFVAREPDSEDRRITRAVLTEEGLALRGEIRVALREEFDSRLPRRGRAELIAALTTAAAALSAAPRMSETA